MLALCSKWCAESYINRMLLLSANMLQVAGLGLIMLNMQHASYFGFYTATTQLTKLMLVGNHWEHHVTTLLSIPPAFFFYIFTFKHSLSKFPVLAAPFPVSCICANMVTHLSFCTEGNVVSNGPVYMPPRLTSPITAGCCNWYLNNINNLQVCQPMLGTY